MGSYVVNELLCFFTTRFNKLDREQLSKSIIDHYAFREIVAAKALLISEVENINVTSSIDHLKSKHRESSQNALPTTVKELCELWHIVDTEAAGKLNVTFVAADLNRVPSVHPEKYDLNFLIATILSLKEQLTQQKSQLDSVEKELKNLTGVKPAVATPAASRKRTLSATAENFTPATKKPSKEGAARGQTIATLVNTNKLSAASQTVSASASAASLASAQTAEPPSASAVNVKTFAKTAGAVAVTKREWSLSGAIRRKNIASVIGSNTSSSLEAVASPVRDYWDLSVTRLKDNTTPDKVKSSLQGYGVEVKETWVFNSRIQGAKTAKVRVAREHKDKAKTPAFWPPGAKIHDWVYVPKSLRKTHANNAKVVSATTPTPTELPATPDKHGEPEPRLVGEEAK